MRKTIKYINGKMEEWVNNHKQLKCYKFGPILNFDELEYPLLWNFVNGKTYKRGEKEIKMSTYILDRVLKDISNYEDVLNDTDLIGDDFTIHFIDDIDETLGFEMDDVSEAEQIDMDYDANISGFKHSTVIRVPHDLDGEAAPME